MNDNTKELRLLSPDHISEMLGLKRKTVIDHYVKQPGFPRPIGGKKLVWLESEVLKFWKAKSVQKANI